MSIYEPDAIRLSEVTPERVTWLWPGRLPRGKVVVLDGDPGLGKSTIAEDLAARTSTGSPMPDGHRLDGPAGVVLLTAEDARPTRSYPGSSPPAATRIG